MVHRKHYSFLSLIGLFNFFAKNVTKNPFLQDQTIVEIFLTSVASMNNSLTHPFTELAACHLLDTERDDLLNCFRQRHVGFLTLLEGNNPRKNILKGQSFLALCCFEWGSSRQLWILLCYQNLCHVLKTFLVLFYSFLFSFFLFMYYTNYKGDDFLNIS